MIHSSDDILKQVVELSSEKYNFQYKTCFLPQGFKENKQFRQNQVYFSKISTSHPHLSVSSYDNILFCLWMSCDLEHLRMLRVQHESNLMELFCEYCLFS